MLDRLFTTGSLRPEDMTRFVVVPSLDEEPTATLIAPAHWSLEAADSFRQALSPAIPSERKAAEENTVPSWLWRRNPRGTESVPEKSVMDVLSRIAEVSQWGVDRSEGRPYPHGR